MDPSLESSHAVRKGVEFLLDSLSRRGSVAQEIIAFHKVPYALALTGHRNKALALLNWIESKSSSGEFASEFLKDTREPALRPYYLGWLALGAAVAGASRTTERAIQRMLKYQNQRLGGFYSERRSLNEGVLHFQLTSICGYACACLDRIHEATKAGDFLIRIVKAQPDPSRLYYRLDTERGLLLNYPIDTTKKRQPYSVLGGGMLFLSQLYRLTEEKEYADTARTLFRFGLSCQPDILESFPGAKFGWGSSLLYEIDKDPSEKRVAQRISKYMRRSQNEDGSWPILGLGWERALRLWRFNKTNLTAELVVILTKISENLGQSRSSDAEPIGQS